MSGWAIKGLLAVCGLLFSTICTLIITVWMAWNIPGRLDELSKQSQVIERDMSRRE